MTSATTFLPAQLTGSRPGAFQVDLNFVLAAASVATASSTAMAVYLTSTPASRPAARGRPTARTVPVR